MVYYNNRTRGNQRARGNNRNNNRAHDKSPTRSDTRRRDYEPANGSNRGRGRGRSSHRARGHNRGGRPWSRNQSNHRSKEYRSTSHGQHDNRDQSTELRRLQQTITSLTKRIETLQLQRPKKNTPTDRQTSTNNDFAAVSKTLYKWVQLCHHKDNWSQLPRSLSERINKLTDDIRPPMPDEHLHSGLTALATQFSKGIQDLVSQHIRQKLTETENIAASLDPTDLNRARDTANKYLKNRLGRRLDENRRDALLTSAVRMIGTSRCPPTPANTNGLPPTPTTTNDWHQVKSPNGNKPTTPRKRAASVTPEPMASPNRFEVLSDDEAYVINSDDEIIEDSQPGPSTTRLTKKPRPTSATVENASGVRVFTGPKDEWTINADAETQCIIIGDSNLRGVTRVPPHWEIHSLSGAHIHHVTRALSCLSTGQNQQVDVVIQAGINNRTETVTAFTNHIDELLHEARGNHVIKNIFYSGISISDNLPEASNIRRFNATIVSAVGTDSYILPLDPNEVHINPTDCHHIHHTSDTADKIINRIYRRVSGKVF